MMPCLISAICRNRQAGSLRSPEATAPLSHNVSQMSGDEAKIKPASTQFFIPANQQP